MREVVKPRDFRGTLRRLWGLIKGQRNALILVFFLSCLTSGTAMLSPYLIGEIITAFSSESLALSLFIMLFFLYIGDTGIRLFQGFFMARVSQTMLKTVRGVLFGYMQGLPLSFFDKRQHGDLMSRITNDIDNISTTISDSLVQLMVLIITFVGVLIVMLSLNVYLTLAVLLISPLVFILTKIITTRTRKFFRENQRILGRLNGHVEESISGILTVKAYAREQEIIDEFEDINSQLNKIGMKAQIWSGFLMPIMNVINNLCFIFVAVVGGFMAAQDIIGVGVITSFLLYSRQFTRPLNDVASIYNTLQTAVAGAERVFEILDSPPEGNSPEKPESGEIVPLSNPKGRIEFRNVSFGYNEDTLVLKNISFTVEPGTNAAIVGSTGAGKTTIISLLTRWYDVTGGEILLDGVNIEHYSRADLRRCFGVVLQDTALFDMSVMENLRYGNASASDEEVISAAKAAGAHSFIERLPAKYGTILSDNAVTLSQGEKQLLTIARAMLTNAPVFILDEATSYVDTRTERRIKSAVSELTHGRTSFMIAHRLSTIRDCDIIIVIENGEIAEMGSHNELVAKKGRYYEMLM